VGDGATSVAGVVRDLGGPLTISLPGKWMLVEQQATPDLVAAAGIFGCGAVADAEPIASDPAALPVSLR